ncbi:MAG: PSD1 and planctomycete cytochrome C domain-containing protein, partial [Planctomycetota bacterium]
KPCARTVFAFHKHMLARSVHTVPVGIAPVLLVLMLQCFGHLAVASEQIDFAKQVLPILSDKCFVCHGPDTQEEGLVRLDSFEAATADLGGYRALDPNESSASEMLKRIADSDDPMPPVEAKPLTEDEKQILAKWVEQGGAYAEHWAFVAPGRPKLPKDLGESENEIDAFVGREIVNKGSDFAAQADPRTLARRLALTLTGLPPTPELVEEFIEDRSGKAVERYVDRLMQLPSYGEHQTRYWLDAVRYGDTHGLHLDNRRGIYPYRDWVIRAMNRNLRLDDFIVWQLAGDLLEEPTLEQKVATGFVRMNPSTSEGGAIPAEFQAKNNFDRTENIGTVLLGLTFTCARCHTHKYDPITQTEYYEMLAFFNSTAESPMDGNKYEYGTVERTPPDVHGWDRRERLLAKRDAILAVAQRQIVAKKEAEPDGWEEATAWEKMALIAEHDGPFKFSKLQDKSRQTLERWETLQSSFTTTLVAKDLSKPRATKVLERGEYDRPIGSELIPGLPESIGSDSQLERRDRLGLARWIVSRDNPLTARVVVNRIWQRVFGYGLVRTPEDFGVQGEHPTHPELLDWLAVELQESGWDLQHMLKLMVTSRTYQQSSQWREDLDDPENRLFARGPSYRLDAEVIRDTALWASGLLDPTMGGEGVKPYQPAGMWKALAHPASNTKQYVPDTGEKLYRKSIYVYWKRTSPHPMMTLFDAPDREASCVRRSRTSTSLQSLGLFNETQRVEMARKLAERLLGERGDDRSRVDYLFELLASRPANTVEQDACMGLLKAMREKFNGSTDEAVQLLGRGEAQSDAETEPAILAAWTQVCVTVLASDVTILLY